MNEAVELNKICPKCGLEYPDYCNFCRFCGIAIVAKQPSAPVPVAAPAAIEDPYAPIAPHAADVPAEPVAPSVSYVPPAPVASASYDTSFPADPGATVVLSNLSASAPNYPSLLRRSNGEVIRVEKQSFRIGKGEGADYYVNNPAVSRHHAEIRARSGNWFIIDRNSTNGTFVNGERVMFNSEKELRNGDCIILADEEFEFRI